LVCVASTLSTQHSINYGIQYFNYVLLFFSEPNIDSPLNVQAADMWTNQEAYKKVLLEKYDQEVRKKQ
jgi:ubiquitin-protein ligase